MWPYSSKNDFLYYGLVDVELYGDLDCLICRKPLATTATASASSSLHLPDIDINTSLPRLTFSQDTNVDSADVVAETLVNINLISEHAFDARSDDDEIIPEPAFATDTSNRCPECNQPLFPERSLHLVLDHPTREIRIEFAHLVEHALEDADTADQIRSQLMSEWTKTLMRELAVEVHRSRGYKIVTWEYRNPQEHEDVDDDGEYETMDDYDEFETYGDDIDEEEEMIDYGETEDEDEEDT